MRTLLKVTVAINAVCLVALAAFSIAWHIDFRGALAERLFFMSVIPGTVALFAFVPTLIVLFVGIIRGIRARGDASYIALVLVGFAIELALFPLIMYWISTHQV